MKLSEWLKKRSLQEWAMAAAIAMLLIMIATRWAYTTRTAGEAFRRRFIPPAAQADSTAGNRSGIQTDSASLTHPSSQADSPARIP